ncbi:MAG: adenylate/guanylate cyclase domain-containing protein, partial [Rhodospirillales bacterium]|nr:adenylate/guanylate cyclase domain-containing protein [Rhodospirillales bacterium]
IDGSLRLTLDNFEFPAYLINPRCELEWANDAAMDRFIGQNRSLPSEISDRNLFNLLLRDSPIADIVDMPGLIRYHMSIAKNRLTKPSLLSLSQSINPSHMDMLVRIFDEVEPAAVKPVLNSYVNLAKPGEGDRWHVVYTTAFREGYLFTYLPESQDNSSLLQLLGRRDIVIRDLLKKRGPYLTPLAVIVADLKDSLDICASLPPDEYFELVNSIWSSMTPLLRKYYSTQGKHRADGMVYYCFPQPDSNYILNAIRCATEMKSVMREISNKWRKKKNWMNELELNIGIDEGHEWFGTYQTPSHLELTALGDTLTIASRLSDFARSGTIWITKNGLGKLSLPDRETVHYGIRRSSTDGFEALVPSTYSRISNLVDLNDPKNMSYQDIAVLPVTEILDVEIDSDD